MTLYIASSELVGRRPRISRIRAYSSALRPRSAQGCSRAGSSAARATVSRPVSSPIVAGAGTAAIYRRPPRPSVSGSADEPVGHDLEERADGGRVEVGLVGHGGHAADEAGHLDGLDAVLERTVLAEPVDDPVARADQDLALGEDRRVGVAHRRGDLGPATL